jgi:hypothetical protein
MRNSIGGLHSNSNGIQPVYGPDRQAARLLLFSSAGSGPTKLPR